MPTFSSHSVPTEDNLPNATPTPTHLTGNFVAKTAFIQLVERSQFGGMPSEDPHQHMETFCDYCEAITQTGVTQDQIRWVLFPFSLIGTAKQWLKSLDKTALGIDSWKKLALAFYKKFYPPEKTNMLRAQITGFKQRDEESLYESWERFKSICRSCPHHGLTEWFLVQQFWNGLYEDSRNILNMGSNGRFTEVDDNQTWAKIEEMAIHNSQYSRPRKATRGGLHEVNSVTQLSADLSAQFNSHMDAFNSRFDEALTKITEATISRQRPIQQVNAMGISIPSGICWSECPQQ